MADVVFTHYDSLASQVAQWESRRGADVSGRFHNGQTNADAKKLIGKIRSLMERLERLKSI